MHIRPVEDRDLSAIETILVDWLVPAQGDERRQAEVASRMEALRSTGSAAANRQMLVAEVDGEILGLVGLATDGIAPELIEPGERAAELISAYVRRDAAGRGIGTLLADEVEARARRAGFDTLIVVSGTRHRERGYPFWTRRYGDPVRRDEDFWGPGSERVVWRADLRR